jgi:hypothetical protein
MFEVFLEASSPVRDIARAALAGLTSAPASHLSIRTELADLGIRRHKCGPLLFAAWRAGARVDADADALLSEHWAQNRRQYLRNAVSVERIGVALAGSTTPALVFKGAPLAQQLYADPLCRHCGDVDILASPDAMIPALQALTGAGLGSDDALLTLSPGLQRLVFGVTRDVGLDDSWTQSHIELHSRLLFSKRLSRLLMAREETLRPQPVPGTGKLAAPRLSASLALYLILHGCVSGWCRLKWLIDLIPLLEKLGPEGQRSLADDAERYGVAAAVKASLAVLRAVFVELDLGALGAWLIEKPGEAAVQSRARLYLAWLQGDEASMPLTARRQILRSTLLVNDRLSDQLRLLGASAISSGMRQVACAVTPG